MPRVFVSARWVGLLWRVVPAAALGILAVGMMLYLAGRFEHKVPGASTLAGPSIRRAGNARLEPVRLIRLPGIESAVGTVRPVYESQVAARIMARVIEVDLKAGQPVKRGQVLVRLDDADLMARRQQFQAALTAAQAARDQAAVEVQRVERLFENKAANQLELDRYRTALKTAQAQVQQAEQSVRESESQLSNATILSPFDGTVIDKRISAGDIATPGQVLATLYDPTRMQLVASVRESLAQRLKPGQPIDVRIEAINQTCAGQVSEIVPEAEAASRSFLVKVTGPCHPGVYAGMFGRLLIPLEEQELLVVPRSAIQKVGQLEMVDVAEGDALKRRAVTLGRSLENGLLVEVLSGLRVGDKVVVGGDAARVEASSHG